MHDVSPWIVSSRIRGLETFPEFPRVAYVVRHMANRETSLVKERDR